MTIEGVSEAQLEAELMRLARSRQSGTKLQARTAALRTVLRGRQRQREAAERAKRDRQRKRERQQAERERELRLPPGSLPTWLDLSLSDEDRLGWFRLDTFDAGATVEDLNAAAERWRARRGRRH